MPKREPWRAAMAVLAAVAGTAFASGRELAVFFAQLGRASWLGVAAASAAFGLLTALLARRLVRAGGLAGLCRGLGPRAGRLVRGMYALLLGVDGWMMLVCAGRLGELALPLRHGFLAGAALALLVALLANLFRLRPLPALGLLAVAAALVFYGGLALDPRPVRTYLRVDVESALWDSVPAALLLALAYAAMNACLAAGVAGRFGRGVGAGLGARCGAALCAVLLCANAAMARGGRVLLAQALPTVLLAARWGLAGFWLCAGFGFLCAACTLSAALGGLMDLFGGADEKPAPVLK